MSKLSQVAVRWPSSVYRRSSQSELLRIRVDLYIYTVLCCAYCGLGSRPKDAQDQVEGFQYLSGV